MQQGCLVKPRRCFWSPASPFDLWFVPQKIPTLGEFCLKAIAADDVLKIHLGRIQDIPLSILVEIYPELSVYGKALLEEKVSLKDYDTESFWKHHLKRLTSLHQADLSKESNDEIDSFKSQYFERLLEEVLNRYAEEDSYTGDVPSSLLHFMRTSDLFNLCHECAPQQQLKDLTRLFGKQLLRIRFNSYFLKPIKFLVENNPPGTVTEKVKSLDFHFRHLKGNQSSDIRDIINSKNFPNVSSIAFWRLIIDKTVMNGVRTIIENFIYSFHQDNNVPCIDINSSSDFAQNVIQEHLINDNEVLPEIAQKRMRSHNHGSNSWGGVLLNEETVSKNLCVNATSSNASCMPEIPSCFGSKQTNASRCQLETIEFFTCYIDDDAVDSLCKLLKEMNFLKNFTIKIDHFLHWSSTYKILTALFASTGDSDKNTAQENSIEHIKLHFCDLDYTSKKLLFWHMKGECSDQFGVGVPALKHMELVDCEIDSFLCDCSCMNSPKAVQERQLTRHKLSLNLPKPLHSKTCVENFDWFFDKDLVCVCNWKNLRTIDLSSNEIKCKGATSISSALEGAQQLKSIKMSNCGMKTEGCGCLFAMATRHVSLESLDVSNNLYNPVNDARLATLITTGNLLRLSLESCLEPDSDKDAVMMAFAENSKLISLNLARNGLDDKDMRHFSQALARKDALPSLKKLDLRNNGINSAVIEELACALKQSGRKLDDLQLAGNYVSVSQLKAMGVNDYFKDHVRNWHRNSLSHFPPASW